MKSILSGQVLLVEGRGDKEFFLGLLHRLGKKEVKPAPPAETSDLGNGVDNVVKYIPILIAEIIAEKVTRAAIVVDADHTGYDAGFALRQAQIRAILNGAGFEKVDDSNLEAGEIFANPNYPALVGLYILPNHRDDGMLEDLLKTMAVHQPYQHLMSHACATVAALDPVLFSVQLHASKAEVNTFLAWQKNPPAALRASVASRIFATDTPECGKLIGWLNRIFD